MFAFPFEANFNLVHVAASKNISTNLHVLLANVPKFEPAFHGMLACSILSLTACYANIVENSPSVPNIMHVLVQVKPVSYEL